MAIRSFYTNLTRLKNPQSRVVFTTPFSSNPLTTTSNEEDTFEDDEFNNDLKSRIFRLRLPKRSATTVLEKWVGEGNKISISELRNITKELRKSLRYKHALEISEWMVRQQNFELSDTDYGVRIELMTRVFGIDAAERYFEGLPPSAKTGETYTALLHSYARAKLTEKAEGLFERVNETDIPLNAMTYNEMMTLYMSVGQLEKVPLVIEELKIREVSPDLFTYNLWISSCAANLDIDNVNRILDEMSCDPNSDEGWVIYRQLVSIYVTASNLLHSDSKSLVETEKKITQRECITYDFLIILYTGLKNKERIDQIWKSLRMAPMKMTSRNYICIISSYLMLGHSKEAGEVFEQWMQSTTTDFDSHACSRLLDAFTEAGLMEEAEMLRALMILSWMRDQNTRFPMSAADHGVLIELIIKVRSLEEAEGYFESLTSFSSQKAACIPLLHSHVKERATVRAEAFFQKMQASGLTVNPHPYNEMMKLYVATGQFEKIPFLIQQMKHDRIPRNVLSYNLWMTASCELSGVQSAEKVYGEMLNDNNVEVGWSTYCTLADIYTKWGEAEKATKALQIAERKLSTNKRLGYLFLITLYSRLSNIDGILRLWEASKAVPCRVTAANYMCIISCLLKVGEIAEAEKVFRSWESQCGKYDVRVSNILLGAYARSGRMDKAESLHLRTLEKGGLPNYKTWEILMEGWVKSKDMDKAVSAMKKGFSMLKHCDWRPSSAITMAIAEYFEECGRFEEAKKYVKVLRRLGLATLPLYKALIRVYVNAQTPAPDVVKMMQNDQIEIDEEASALIKCLAQEKPSDT